jgi:cytochrome c
MKKVIFAALLLTGVAFTFTSCKGDKKVEKAADATKEVVKEVVKEVEETTTKAVEEVKEVVTELSAQAKKGLEVMDSFDPANKCAACHKADAKFVGPSYKEIAAKYKAEKGNLVKFLKEEADPIVDPPQFAIMKANLAETKKRSGDDLAAIAAYIRSFE